MKTAPTSMIALYFQLPGSYTTPELNMQIHRFYRNSRLLPLEEREDREILWQGRILEPVTRYVYAPEENRHRDTPEKISRGLPTRFREEGKQLWIPAHSFFRSDLTENRWRSSEGGCYQPLAETQVLRLWEEGGSLEHYTLTRNPDSRASSVSFSWYEAGGEITLTGVNGYTEQLTVPATLEGKPVTAAYIKASQQLRHLRTLTVEEGVRRLSFDWGQASLERISLPPSLVLTRQPEDIRRTAWFASQPEGPVYFQGWYLGTKGCPDIPVLTLREGTAGVIRYADTFTWRRIRLPASLGYIGQFAFPVSRIPPLVEYAPGTEGLADAFDTLSRILWSASADTEALPPPQGIPLREVTGEMLYALGRRHASLRPDVNRKWIPLVPRFRYHEGSWTADFLYCTEDLDRIGFMASVDVATGRLLDSRRLYNYTPVWSSGVWTESYITPFYLLGEAYLRFCAGVIRTGAAPSETQVKQLQDWWDKILPEEVKGILWGETQEQYRSYSGGNV